MMRPTQLIARATVSARVPPTHTAARGPSDPTATTSSPTSGRAQATVAVLDQTPDSHAEPSVEYHAATPDGPLPTATSERRGTPPPRPGRTRQEGGVPRQSRRRGGQIAGAPSSEPAARIEPLAAVASHRWAVRSTPAATGAIRRSIHRRAVDREIRARSGHLGSWGVSPGSPGAGAVRRVPGGAGRSARPASRSGGSHGHRGPRVATDHLPARSPRVAVHPDVSRRPDR